MGVLLAVATLRLVCGDVNEGKSEMKLRVWYLCITSKGVALFTERSRKRAEYLAGLDGVKLTVVKVREEK